MEAGRRENVLCLNYLVERGAVVNAVDGGKRTVLHWAAITGLSRAFELLCARTDVNAVDGEGNTPFVYALRKGNPEHLSILLRSGAVVSYVDGSNPLKYAATRGYSQCLHVIIESIRKRNDSCLSPEIGFRDTTIRDASRSLTSAAAGGHTECVSKLINIGADVNIADNDGRTPLIHAAENGHNDCVAILLIQGADANRRDKDGHMALTHAVENGYEKCIKLLSFKCIELASFNSETDMVFHCAQSHPQALVNAVKQHNRTTVDMLMKKGFTVDAPDENGLTALMYHKGPCDTRAHNGYEENLVHALVRFGADVNATDSDETTALIYAIKNGCKECVEALTRAGADVNRYYRDGMTALIYAAVAGETYSVHTLIKSEADVNQTDYMGNTPLMHVAGADPPTLESICCLAELVVAGAHVNRVNNAGRTALRICAKAMVKNEDENDDFAERTARLLIAAGEDLDDVTRKLIAAVEDLDDVTRKLLPWDEIPGSKDDLQDICRKALRKHLKEIDSRTNLYCQVLKLGLPKLLQKYLLYNIIDEEQCF